MNSDVDNNEMSSPRSADSSSNSEGDHHFFREQEHRQTDKFPDQVSNQEKKSILTESYFPAFSADKFITEELSTDMTNNNMIEARFQSLLKNRLLQETEGNPPRFPWETGSEAYFMEEAAETGITNDFLWKPQLASFDLPFKMPQSTLKELVQACSVAMQSLNPQGLKLVKAVESLFDVDPMMLHKMANLVISQPQGAVRGPAAVLEGDYATADEQQRIVISMLAAQKIMENLVVSLSPAESTGETELTTTAGTITLNASYIEASETHLGNTIRVFARLPQGGTISWDSPQGSATASRMYPGELCLTLTDCLMNGIYPVTITLNQADQESLTVAISLNPA